MTREWSGPPLSTAHHDSTSALRNVHPTTAAVTQCCLITRLMLCPAILNKGQKSWPKPKQWVRDVTVSNLMFRVPLSHRTQESRLFSLTGPGFLACTLDLTCCRALMNAGHLVSLGPGQFGFSQLLVLGHPFPGVAADTSLTVTMFIICNPRLSS